MVGKWVWFSLGVGAFVAVTMDDRDGHANLAKDAPERMAWKATATWSGTTSGGAALAFNAITGEEYEVLPPLTSVNSGQVLVAADDDWPT